MFAKIQNFQTSEAASLLQISGYVPAGNVGETKESNTGGSISRCLGKKASRNLHL